ncbi:MAG: hypothetical protein RMZ41_000705 [Nostoc sp. DedVER02]|uniref:hypothetical protein n=1 Tax=unclassified Nostoc TaxID=2593658 RepID=UPI002AD2EC38|nr:MULTISPECIES: hypothetical protein [unclassified Nostoc]MDZ7988013.1 hypothetical protein [Nostoc sp. DedVER02]MDZ8114938.1 hypothetical protein [Nostoc sp. DedVER01b]
MPKIQENESIKSLRKIAQKLGLGKALLQIHQLRALTLKGAFKLNLAKSRYLKKILTAKPIPAGEGAIEVHMLLHHKRIYEGLWALYSFAYFCDKPCRIVVHNDGSLTNIDLGLLNQLLPQCQVIDRETANSVVLNYFHQAGLIKCAQFREKLIFALKLFDPFFFSKNRAFILLDSDVLFFSRPQELLDGIEANENPADLTNLYSVDNSYRYSLQSTELATLLGKDCIERFNPGVLRAYQGTLDFMRIEQYLQCKDFWNEDGTANYYAELTLWAMELTRSNALPLPNTYAICPDPKSPNVVSGHYCGGGYWASLFYTRGLPCLASSFLD